MRRTDPFFCENTFWYVIEIPKPEKKIVSPVNIVTSIETPSHIPALLPESNVKQ